MKIIGQFLEEEAIYTLSQMQASGTNAQYKLTDKRPLILDTMFDEPYNYDLIIEDRDFEKAIEFIKSMYGLDTPIIYRTRCYKCTQELSGKIICERCGTINSLNGIVRYWNHPVVYFMIKNGYLTDDHRNLYNLIRAHENNKCKFTPRQINIFLGVIIATFIVILILYFILD